MLNLKSNETNEVPLLNLLQEALRQLHLFQETILQQEKMISQLQEQLQLRDQELNLLKDRIKELEGQLAKNSRNSGKPPSSDGLKKPNPKSQRENGGRKTGGQAGHSGHTLEQVKHPDFIEIQGVNVCEQCQHALDGVAPVYSDRRQEFEIPAIKVEVTEHQAEWKICPHCQFLNKAKFPEQITQPVQYGKRVKSIAIYLNQEHLLPYKRLQRIFSDLYNLSLSEGTLVNFNAACYKRLEGFDAVIVERLKASKVAHFDETGMRVKKKLHWLHVASTDKLTHYEIHEKRGTEAMDKIGILPEFKGRAIHDHWKPYFQYPIEHGLCNAHHLREFVYHEEQYNQTWCSKMKTCLLTINDEVDRCRQAGDTQISTEQLSQFAQTYDDILNDGLKEIPDLNEVATTLKKKKRGRKKQHPTKNLWDRLFEYKKETLAFMYDFNVPFTNNQGEQDIRMNKVKQKISGCFRSQQGGNIFCRIRGYVSTVRKNGLNILESLSQAFSGNPFMPPANASWNNSS